MLFADASKNSVKEEAVYEHDPEAPASTLDQNCFKMDCCRVENGYVVRTCENFGNQGDHVIWTKEDHLACYQRSKTSLSDGMGVR